MLIEPLVYIVGQVTDPQKALDSISQQESVDNSMYPSNAMKLEYGIAKEKSKNSVVRRLPETIDCHEPCRDYRDYNMHQPYGSGSG